MKNENRDEPRVEPQDSDKEKKAESLKEMYHLGTIAVRREQLTIEPHTIGIC